MSLKSPVRPFIPFALCALFAFGAAASADEDCSREISLKKHPFSAPQEWQVAKNFTIPEGQNKLYFAGGTVGPKLDEKAAAYCKIAAIAPHDNPREFRTHQGETGSDGKTVPTRQIQIAKLEYGIKKKQKTAGCCEYSCQVIINIYRKNGFKLTSRPRTSRWSKARLCNLYDITFERWLPDPSVLNFTASDDKTVSKITCKNVKTYDQLKHMFGDYIQGVKCPDIETEEASVPQKQTIDEDVAVKPSTSADETSDAGETKKSTKNSPSGQTTN